MGPLEGDAVEECLQDLRGGHGRPVGRHGQRGGPLPRGLQEVVPGDGRRHAGRREADVLRDLLLAPTADVHALSDGALRPARPAGGAREGFAALPADRLGRRHGTDRQKAADHTARSDLLLLQWPFEQRSRLPAAALRAALRHEPRQQLQLLLPPGQRRRPHERDWQRCRHRQTRRYGTLRHGLPDRRQPGQQPSAADADADDGPPSRRESGVDQSDHRDRHRELLRAERSVGALLRRRDREHQRAAACGRRPRPALWHDEAAAGTAPRSAETRRFTTARSTAGRPHRRRGVSHPALRWLARTGCTAREPLLGGDRRKVGRVEAPDRRHHGAVCRLEAGDLRLDDGRDPPAARCCHRAGDRATRTHASHGWQARRRPPADPRSFQHPGHGHRRRDSYAQESDLRPAGKPLRREAADDQGLRHARMPRRGRRGRDAVCPLPRRQPLWREPRGQLCQTSDGEDRHGGLHEHVAQHRPRLGHGRRGDDHPAGTRARRGAGAFHTGEHVQLHPPLRRRQAPACRPAERGGDYRRPGPPSAGRCVVSRWNEPGGLAGDVAHEHDPRGDREDRARARGDRGDRPHEEGVFDSGSGP